MGKYCGWGEDNEVLIFILMKWTKCIFAKCARISNDNLYIGQADNNFNGHGAC